MDPLNVDQTRSTAYTNSGSTRLPSVPHPFSVVSLMCAEREFNTKSAQHNNKTTQHVTSAPAKTDQVKFSVESLLQRSNTVRREETSRVTAAAAAVVPAEAKCRDSEVREEKGAMNDGLPWLNAAQRFNQGTSKSIRYLVLALCKQSCYRHTQMFKQTK